MNDDALEARLRRLRPANLPVELLRHLDAAEPAPGRRFFLPWYNAQKAGLDCWPVAYAALLVAWVFIAALHLATPSTPTAVAYVTTVVTPAVAPVGASPSPLLAVGGFSIDPSPLFADNRPLTPAASQP